MPRIFDLRLNRRRFLRESSIAGAALVAAGCVSHRGAGGDRPFHVALLSDTHTPEDRANEYRGFKPWENLQRIVPAVVGAGPECVLLNGDAARLEGKPGDYAQLRSLLAPLAAQTPIYIGLGNHDHRGNFREAFPDQPGETRPVPDKLVLVIEQPALRIIQLDSLLYVNEVAGLLGREQRTWLADFLRSADRRTTILFVHHTLTDGDGDLLDVDRLFDLLKPHRHVKAIFYGHSHVWATGERQGIKMINLPAVGYNFRDEDPVGWVEARFDSRGADLKLHALAGNTLEDGRTTRVNWS